MLMLFASCEVELRDNNRNSHMHTLDRHEHHDGGGEHHERRDEHRDDGGHH